MRVLFTDFDGVLHALAGPSASMRSFVWAPLLADLLEPHPEVRLVVHASARQHSPSDFLISRMGPLAPRVLGVTPPRLGRWPSIVEWLAARPQVQDYCILDDAAGEFPQALSQLVVCPPRTGVSDPEVQASLRRWLEAT